MSSLTALTALKMTKIDVFHAKANFHLFRNFLIGKLRRIEES